MKGAFRSGLAALVLAGSLYSGEPVNRDHANWLAAVERTGKIREQSPEKISKLEGEVFHEAVKYKPDSSAKKTKLSDYLNVSQRDLVDVFTTNAHYTTNVVTDLVDMLQYDWTSIPREKRKGFIEGRAREVEENPDFKKYIESKYSNSKVDCRLHSSIAAAMYLNMDGDTEVELVTGIFFDKKHAPTGEGHQWAKAGGEIIDPAIQVPTTPENYIPLMAVRIRRSEGKFTLSPKIYCLTPEMESKISK